MLKFYLSILISSLSILTKAQVDSLNYLNKGDKAPLFETKNFDNQIVTLSSLLKKGKVVIVFYRGAWCPYCNKHMSHLQDSLNLILDKGASVIAITPETDASIEKTVFKTKATFTIAHDSEYVIMKKYGVAYQLSKSKVKLYNLFGIDLEESNGNKDNILPVPATFIINENGTIEFIHFDENYKKRLSVNSILKHL